MAAPTIYSPTAMGFAGAAEEIQSILAEREHARMLAEQQARVDAQQQFENNVKLRQVAVQERLPAAKAPTTVRLAGMLGKDGKTKVTLVDHGDGRTEELPEYIAPEKPGPAGSDYHQFLERWATSHKKTVADLTADEELQAHKEYNPVQPFVLGNGPNGPITVNRETATARPIVDGAGKPVGPALTPNQRTQEMDAQQGAATLDEVEKTFKPEYVGPAGGRAYSVREKLPEHMGMLDQILPLDPQRSAFTSALARNRNRVIKLITGAQVGEKEADRIMGELPSEEQPETVFRQRLAQSRRNVDTLLGLIGNLRSQAPEPEASHSQANDGAITVGKFRVRVK